MATYCALSPNFPEFGANVSKHARKQYRLLKRKPMLAETGRPRMRPTKRGNASDGSKMVVSRATKVFTECALTAH